MPYISNAIDDDVLFINFRVALSYEGDDVGEITRQLDYDDFLDYLPDNLSENDQMKIWKALLAMLPHPDDVIELREIELENDTDDEIDHYQNDRDDLLDEGIEECIAEAIKKAEIAMCGVCHKSCKTDDTDDLVLIAEINGVKHCDECLQKLVKK